MNAIPLKISALLMALLLCLCSVAACAESGGKEPAAGGETASAADGTAGETTAAQTPGGTATPAVTTGPDGETTQSDAQTLIKPEIGERFDADGEPKEISFCVSWAGPDHLMTRSISVEIDFADNPVDLTYEPNLRVLERNRQITDEIGTKIKVKRIINLSAGGMNELIPVLLSQEPLYDVMALYQYYDLDIAYCGEGGSFYSLENMPAGVTDYLNLDAPYWNKASYEALQLTEPQSGEKHACYFTGDLTMTSVCCVAATFVNAKMWENYKEKIAALESSGGYGELYDIVDNGYWTLDLWIDLANLVYEDLNNNGVPDQKDSLGLLLYNKDSNVNNMSVDYLSYGARVRYSEPDENGNPAATVNSEHNLDFFEKQYRLYCESKVGTMKYSGNPGKRLIDYFIRGNVLMIVERMYTAEEYLGDMTDDYYVVPLPMLDRAQYDKTAPSKGYATCIDGGLTQFAICTFGGDERLPAITATLELMGYYSAKQVIPAYYACLLHRGGQDRRALRMLDTIRAGVYADFAVIRSQNLGHIDWVMRENYDHDRVYLTNLLKQKQADLKGRLKNLLDDYFYGDHTPGR